MYIAKMSRSTAYEFGILKFGFQENSLRIITSKMMTVKSRKVKDK